jgi:murein DD-endopeptidase MepM/ murein hydrolase activator NlpD
MAQDGGNTTEDGDGETTIHIVQRGDNLFDIALRYGTSVEAIANANNIADTRFLSIGQRLLIPNANPNAPGVNTTHLVQPGENLYTIALRYRSSMEHLANLNDLTHPDRLYAGMELTVRQGSEGESPPDNAGLYVAQPGDNPLRIAARFGVSLSQLQAANNWPIAVYPIYLGQRILVPSRPDAGEFVYLPEPLLSFRINPLPVVQGESIGIQLQTVQPVQVNGQFMGNQVQLVPLDNNTYATVLGIHAFTEPGVYSLSLMLTLADGMTVPYQVGIQVLDGGYGSETINIPADRQNLLAPSVVQSELDRLLQIVTTFNPERYFDGLLALPAPGAVTSGFGTRRSYNGGPLNTFHGGVDFGGAVGTQLTAPADGMVVLAEALQVRGNAVVIDHGWGVYTGYWHQSQIYVETGQVINKGDLIGTLGATGLVTGAHLHWEMWVGGVQVDPLQWVQQQFP